jgi:STAM-binding protein
LLLDKLSTHPDIKLGGNQAAYKRATKDLKFNMSRLEHLKPTIKARHEQYKQAAARRKAEREEWLKSRPPQSEKFLASTVDGMSAASVESGGSHKRIRREIYASDGRNQSLALSLAHKEQKKRRIGHSSYAGQSLNEDVPKPVDDYETPRKDGNETDDLARQIIAAGKRGESHFIERNGTYSNDGATFTPRNYNYPTVPHKNDNSVYSNKSQPPPGTIRRDTLDTQRSMAPARPPKEYFGYSEPPTRPPKERDWPEPLQPQPPPLPGKVQASELIDPISREMTATPEVNSQDYTFAPSAKTEAGNPLRTVFINPSLRQQFLNIAQANTSNDLETCGILCGTLISNAFFISKLVIPEQESTANTCDTVNEEALFDYCDTHDLMTLGWIHTHPSQTCFMSSRDLHTHAGYQVQMAESIAIVCAPRYEPS